MPLTTAMKPVMGLTSKKGLIYYTLSGNTLSMIEMLDLDGFEVVPLNRRTAGEINLLQYDVLAIATSTLGDGELPKIFKRLLPQFHQLKGKEIILFGSGNSLFQHYCGALDVLENFLKRENRILFTYKFEEYPTDQAISELNGLFKTL